MKSPFPGMDPFIEACGLWEDFHDAFVRDIKASLNQRLPNRYHARTSERAYVVLTERNEEKEHLFKPDVAVTTAQKGSNAGTAVIEDIIVAKPVIMHAIVSEEFRETFVEVREAGSEQVVTYIEVLSPSNKKPSSEGWSVYLRKRQALFMQRSANLIEIDLLRGGKRMPMHEPWPASPYTLLVARMNHAPLACEVFSAYSTSALPSIPVPLLKSDPDVVLDLQPIIDAIYTGDRYHQSLDYTVSLTQSLSDSEAAFLK